MSDSFRKEHDDLLQLARSETAPEALRARVLGSVPPPGGGAAGGGAPAATTITSSLRGWAVAASSVGAMALVALAVFSTSPRVEPAVVLPSSAAPADVPPVMPLPVVSPSAPTEPAPVASHHKVNRVAASAATEEAEADSLGAEASLLGEAKRALSTDRPADADTALVRYQQRYPRGALREEAQALRIEVDLKLGRRENAERAFAAFSRAHPGSPAAARLARLLDDR